MLKIKIIKYYSRPSNNKNIRSASTDGSKYYNRCDREFDYNDRNTYYVILFDLNRSPKYPNYFFFMLPFNESYSEDVRYKSGYYLTIYFDVFNIHLKRTR